MQFGKDECPYCHRPFPRRSHAEDVSLRIIVCAWSVNLTVLGRWANQTIWIETISGCLHPVLSSKIAWCLMHICDLTSLPSSPAASRHGTPHTTRQNISESSPAMDESMRTSTASHIRLNANAFNQGYYEKFFVEKKKLGRGFRGSVFLCEVCSGYHHW